MSTEMPGTLVSATVGRVGTIRGVWGERAAEGAANATKRIQGAPRLWNACRRNQPLLQTVSPAIMPTVEIHSFWILSLRVDCVVLAVLRLLLSQAGVASECIA